MVNSPGFTSNTTHDPNTLLNQTEFLKLEVPSVVQHYHLTRVYDPDNTAYFKVDPTGCIKVNWSKLNGSEGLKGKYLF